MTHSAFILAAYGVAFAGLLTLTLVLILDNRAQRRALADLEARGVRRRSERRTP
ncbi:heme exporter protein CcmD [Aquabacter cavernae]|uniref:heme exporter protein CcmD n=1 Tax=Aquabacter cavernae TaxID=2496029 RepID=UPI000F8C33CC|nr:heme exporter protein CcmD [Aquabacter cavernae]